MQSSMTRRPADARVTLADRVSLVWGNHKRAGDAESSNDLRIQFVQAIETFRFLLGLERQAWAVFAAGDVLLVVYAFNLGVAGPVYFGLALLGALLAGSVSLYHQLVPVAYTAYRTERAMGVSAGMGLASIYGRARANDLIDHFDRISEMPAAQRARALRSAMRVNQSIGIRALTTISVLMAIQLTLALTLTFGFQYPLFSDPRDGVEQPSPGSSSIP